ncbi:MAG TPA: hypothetical protein VF472_13020 [Burkholderiaceae bacterium]
MKIKITLPKAPKPRNPVALPARQRKAGSHDAYNPRRAARRIAKHELRLQLLGRREDDND